MPPSDPGGEAWPPQRILIVDDEGSAAESMAALLWLLGNEVRVSHDGPAGVAEAERFRPGVVLVNAGLPQDSGLEAARQIRAQPWGKAVRIVALSGWIQEGDRAKSRDAGCDAHLVKPVALPALQAVLEVLRGG